MEEVILEVLLGLKVHHPPGVLELDLIQGPLQHHGIGGDLTIPLANLIEVLHENVKGGHHAKDN